MAELSFATAEDRGIIEGLFNAYAREFSLWHPVEFNPDGTFTYRELADYWRDPECYPFLIRQDGAIAGFALVRRVNSPLAGDMVWDVAEYFIAEPYRRHGTGQSAACAIWARFPGRWQVRVLKANHPAMLFWTSTVRIFTGAAPEPIDFEAGGNSWRGFLFDSYPPPESS